MAGHLRTELIAAALFNAVAVLGLEPGVVFHSDRGCQCTSAAYAALAEENQVVLSVGRTGQCWDNVGDSPAVRVSNAGCHRASCA